MKSESRKEAGDGLLAAVEGIDGSGKSLLVENLKSFFGGDGGHSVTFLEEPTGFLSQEIKADHGREFGTELNALLCAADRLKQHDEIAKRALDDNELIISDRSVVSSLAYQGAAGVPLDWIETVNRYVRFPDLVILLDLPPSKGIERIADRNETTNFENAVNRIEFQRTVRKNYLELAEKHQDSFYTLRSDHYSPKDLVHTASEEILRLGGLHRRGSRES